MDFCVIPPLNDRELMREGDRVFALAQLYIKDEKYRKYVQHLKNNLEMFVILDNGAGDHDLVTADVMIDCIKDLMPHEVIPPDVLFDKDTTIANCELFVERLTAEGLIDKVNLLFCPQGKTKEEWLECYQYGLDNAFVSTIGFSKIAVPFAFMQAKNDENIMQARHMAYDLLMSQGLIKKPIHCLGAGDPREFSHYIGNELMRSTDSCFSVWSAMNDISWEEGNFTRVPTPKDYFTRPSLSLDQYIKATHNIDYLKKICKGVG